MRGLSQSEQDSSTEEEQESESRQQEITGKTSQQEWIAIYHDVIKTLKTQLLGDTEGKPQSGKRDSRALINSAQATAIKDFFRQTEVDIGEFIIRGNYESAVKTIFWRLFESHNHNSGMLCDLRNVPKNEVYSVVDFFKRNFSSLFKYFYDLGVFTTDWEKYVKQEKETARALASTPRTSVRLSRPPQYTASEDSPRRVSVLPTSTSTGGLYSPPHQERDDEKDQSKNKSASEIVADQILDYLKEKKRFIEEKYFILKKKKKNVKGNRDILKTEQEEKEDEKENEEKGKTKFYFKHNREVIKDNQQKGGYLVCFFDEGARAYQKYSIIIDEGTQDAFEIIGYDKNGKNDEFGPQVLQDAMLMNAIPRLEAIKTEPSKKFEEQAEICRKFATAHDKQVSPPYETAPLPKWPPRSAQLFYRRAKTAAKNVMRKRNIHNPFHYAAQAFYTLYQKELSSSATEKIAETAVNLVEWLWSKGNLAYAVEKYQRNNANRYNLGRGPKPGQKPYEFGQQKWELSGAILEECNEFRDRVTAAASRLIKNSDGTVRTVITNPTVCAEAIFTLQLKLIELENRLGEQAVLSEKQTSQSGGHLRDDLEEAIRHTSQQIDEVLFPSQRPTLG